MTELPFRRKLQRDAVESPSARFARHRPKMGLDWFLAAFRADHHSGDLAGERRIIAARREKILPVRLFRIVQIEPENAPR